MPPLNITLLYITLQYLYKSGNSRKISFFLFILFSSPIEPQSKCWLRVPKSKSVWSTKLFLIILMIFFFFFKVLHIVKHSGEYYRYICLLMFVIHNLPTFCGHIFQVTKTVEVQFLSYKYSFAKWQQFSVKMKQIKINLLASLQNNNVKHRKILNSPWKFLIVNQDHASITVCELLEGSIVKGQKLKTLKLLVFPVTQHILQKMKFFFT